MSPREAQSAFDLIGTNAPAANRLCDDCAQKQAAALDLVRKRLLCWGCLLRQLGLTSAGASAAREPRPAASAR